MASAQSPSPPPTIRPAGPGDEQLLGALDRRAWSTRYSVQPRPQPPYEPFFGPERPPAHHLVAELEGEGLVGYVRCEPPSGLAAHAHVRQINGLVVDERARGRGVGRALLEGACARARRQGAVRMTLRVLGHNVPARALYKAAGFREEGLLPGEFLLEGEYVDDVVMGRTLR